jgi:ribose transport system ATP-binding protein
MTNQQDLEVTRNVIPTASGAADVVLRLDAVDKSYPGVHALKAVSLEVRRGEIHALVGENGAGKSTLVGIAAGSIQADSGAVEIEGKTIAVPTPDWCRESGLAIVYQEPALLPDLTVAENMALAMPAHERPAVAVQLSWAQGLLDRWSSVRKIEAHLPVRELRPDARFVVEISRALASDPRVIILDEPTEHLLPPAVEELFRLIGEQVQRGASIVYISHRLNEVKRIADTVSVLRDGALVGTFSGGNLSEQDVVNLVVGHEVAPREHRATAEELGKDAYLVVSGFSGRGFHDLALSVRAGEIIGFAGIEGQGQREALRALAGLGDGRGSVVVNDHAVSTRSPATAKKGGVLYLPQDRHNEGVLPAVTLRENATIAGLRKISRGGFLSGRLERRLVAERFGALRVKAPSSDVDIDTLSGGNQQKVILSRVLIAGSEVILADEPTQGVDVGVREEIYEILREAAREGIAVVVLSASAAELERLCDRVLVFSRGTVVAELHGQALTEHAITQAALTASVSRRVAEEERTPPRDPLWRKVARSDLTPTIVLSATLFLLGVVATINSPFYLSERNFNLFLPTVAILGFFAVAQQMVMIIGGIDLSVGPLAGLLVVVASYSLAEKRTPVGIVVGIGVVILAAAGAGLLNWWLVTILRITPLIATLITFTLFGGIAFVLRPLPEGAIDVALLNAVVTRVWILPLSLALALLLALGLEFWLRRTSGGIHLRGVGSNPDTAYRVGLSTRRASLIAYVGCSLLVVPAAFMLMAQSGAGNASIGDSYTLASIAAAVLGGASIFGGRGSFVGALAGAALILQINTVVQFLGLDINWQNGLLAALTIAAVAFYSKTRALLEKATS